MTKSEKTKSSIMRYIDFFRNNVGDYDFPTQMEVSKNTGIAYRTVQRYYEAKQGGHQTQKVNTIRLNNYDTNQKWMDIEFEFWRDYHQALRMSNAKTSYTDFFK